MLWKESVTNKIHPEALYNRTCRHVTLFSKKGIGIVWRGFDKRNGLQYLCNGVRHDFILPSNLVYMCVEAAITSIVFSD